MNKKNNLQQATLLESRVMLAAGMESGMESSCGSGANMRSHGGHGSKGGGCGEARQQAGEQKASHCQGKSKQQRMSKGNKRGMKKGQQMKEGQHARAASPQVSETMRAGTAARS